MSKKMHTETTTVLCILDGWGERSEENGNAIKAARTPVMDGLKAHAPFAVLEASETFVGLPFGQMGNSEVGHMNIGAGRVVLQDLPRIDAEIDSGAFAQNDALGRFADKLSKSGGTAHILGLLSNGGVHSHQNHMIAILQFMDARNIPVQVHGFLDGRDTPPRSARQMVEAFYASLPDVGIATLCGRFWAMDRDSKWDRIQRCYDAIVDGKALSAKTPLAAIDASYAADISDEFIRPFCIGDYQGMQDGDGIVMANFRADRSRQLLSALVDPEFSAFERRHPPHLAANLGMISYSSHHDTWFDRIFAPEDLEDVLGDVISKRSLRQLRIAETEKYAHVTFFLNGGREEGFAGEDRILVPSPDVDTFDKNPQMSALEVTDHLVKAIRLRKYALIVVNYANTDMVGHTGVFDAAVQAVECVDACLGHILEALKAVEGSILITADHGNADMMIDPDTGIAHTAHTLSQVPIILAGKAQAHVHGLENGRLADVAPTVLDVMGLKQPEAMSGKSLLLRSAAQHAAE